MFKNAYRTLASRQKQRQQNRQTMHLIMYLCQWLLQSLGNVLMCFMRHTFQTNYCSFM